ncbi:membrane protein [Amphritea balenae]|nr:membrane protein [Amphritea balenae]
MFMAGSSLLVLIDDIASLLDDVAGMTKVAARKTAGVLGDDLALNAEQVSGVKADRELPVVWAVAKGSLLNKIILVPGALAISYFIPWLIVPLLMLGGLFLCFEGFEKVAHKFLHSAEEDAAHRAELKSVLSQTKQDVLEFEKRKIKGAIRTDFILSAEIIVLTLGTVAAEPLKVQLGVLIGMSMLVTVGVYGLVAGIVKLDDLGLYLAQKPEAGAITRKLGQGILATAPKLMKALSVVGTIAMFMVGGGILVHGLPFLHHFIEHLTGDMVALAAMLLPILLEALVGVIAGGLVLLIIELSKKIVGKSEAA